MYRPPNGDMTVSEKFCENVLSANNKTSKNIFFFFFFAVDLDIQHFLSSMFQYNMIPTRNKPTRGTRNTAEAKTRIITNTVTSVEYTRLEQ